MFTGFTEDTYRFLWELAFHNNREFFEQNRERYKRVLYAPMRELLEALAPTVERIDARLNTRPMGTISRINRDTRYTKDQSPYRDHAWLGFKLPGQFTSECFTLYFEIDREGYGYGMGMYSPEPAMMQSIRSRILARPQQFLALVNDQAFAETFSLEGERYKRPKFTEGDPEILPYLNLRRMTYCFYSREQSKTLRAALLDEVRVAFERMEPVYRFVMGLE